ncbi:cobalt-precorrin-6A reductase [Brenneria goodwinii]|uniref:Cobalt-precorrin-6x reductase n=1 Tax=Brenneria goodwinii TaxID=1109412 RepID=A0A0G4K368_9GAMM|nr:cobalt-precorrin-6A reductase [Brenneria goodwinii]MCG8158765.1 cobalt-precorrin-6A reductase [Brenneria goodwinii]MCG8163220.1 cobalt-precorrin-6A reductase [Brenneria goodwinii]MCG8167641.1 cobalt-precorrin-6A reductase [Brenneria goodwinii]MCG8170547.1 cobalt-precorrin-6A reductase [Brenneria goodwinii]MCG8174453.1 cobalt-precorrin-6A reductase [Brenneria goodwinii]
MSGPAIHVFGGTSDARLICQALDAAGESYRLSVATDTGKQLAGNIAGEVVVGRMDKDEMADFLASRQVRWVVDASHPYADVLHRNVAAACRRLQLPLTRYQRPSDIDAIAHPLLHKTDSLETACAIARPLGRRVLLTTGSKDLAAYRQNLPDKHLLVRVLPTAAVLAQCEALGLGVEQIIAQCGPFSAAFNQALYEHCRPDVVITKESGAPGGYQQKVAPCLALNIPCIVICRPAPAEDAVPADRVASLDEFTQRLSLWRAQRGS